MVKHLNCKSLGQTEKQKKKQIGVHNWMCYREAFLFIATYADLGLLAPLECQQRKSVLLSCHDKTQVLRMIANFPPSQTQSQCSCLVLWTCFMALHNHSAK